MTKSRQPSRSLLKPSEATHLALAGGAVWSLVSLMRGATVLDIVWLGACGGVTLWLAVVALGTLAGDRAVISRIGVATALLLLASLGLGTLLEAKTHHRPLAAVTWVLLSLALSALTALIAFRWRWRPEVAAALFGMALALCVWQLAPALTGAVIAEIVLGLILLAALFWLLRRAGDRFARLWIVSAALMALGCTGAFVAGASARLHQIAPVVAGPIGLLH